jgi:hypothetical protein
MSFQLSGRPESSLRHSAPPGMPSTSAVSANTYCEVGQGGDRRSAGSELLVGAGGGGRPALCCSALLCVLWRRGSHTFSLDVPFGPPAHFMSVILVLVVTCRDAGGAGR